MQHWVPISVHVIKLDNFHTKINCQKFRIWDTEIVDIVARKKQARTITLLTSCQR